MKKIFISFILLFTLSYLNVNGEVRYKFISKNNNITCLVDLNSIVNNNVYKTIDLYYKYDTLQYSNNANDYYDTLITRMYLNTINGSYIICPTAFRKNGNIIYIIKEPIQSNLITDNLELFITLTSL